MIKKNINCKAKQRKTKAYLKWKLLEMPQTKKKKRWWWKPKLAQHNSSTKIVVCEVVFYEEKMLMTTHNTMQQQDTMKKMLYEMQNKKSRIQVCEWTRNKKIENK